MLETSARPGVGTFEPPHLAIASREAIILGQIGERLRPAILVEIVRRGANHMPAGASLRATRLESLSSATRIARSIPSGDNIDNSVRQMHFDGKIRCWRMKEQMRCDMQARESGGAVMRRAPLAAR